MTLFTKKFAMTSNFRHFSKLTIQYSSNLTSEVEKPYANYPPNIIFVLMTSLRGDKISLLYSCLHEMCTFFMIIWKLIKISSSLCTYVLWPWLCQQWHYSFISCVHSVNDMYKYTMTLIMDFGMMCVSSFAVSIEPHRWRGSHNTNMYVLCSAT